ncbi:MAG: sensor histidine kinase [Bradymonadia bacterium]
MSDSILDRAVVLSEVFDTGLLRELCGTYMQLLRAGIKVFDHEHTKIVDLQPRGALGQWPGADRQAMRALAGFTSNLIRLPIGLEERLIREEPSTGITCLTAPITYEGDILGRVVVGPFILDDARGDVSPLAHLFDDGNAALSEHMGAPGPRQVLTHITHGPLLQMVDALLATININCHAGYKAVLTSHMHLESITNAYNELQRKNRKLQESNERLRELDRMKSNFLATVSHELRTPLTSVIGYSEMLLEGLAGDLSGEQQEYVSIIMEKGESLLHLISGILDISKIENGAHDIVLQRARPEQLVEGALSAVRPQAQKKRLDVAVRYADQLPEIKVDTYKIRQVLINLLSNAVKFTPAAGQIQVQVTAQGAPGVPEARVFFSVTDTGIGIPGDKLERIFETFFQVDNSSTREYGGTGLGLAIVKNFVESHGGEVKVSSEPGRGSTFAFDLPLVPPPVAEDDDLNPLR